MAEAYYSQLLDIIKPYLPEDISETDITPESHLIEELNINSAHLIDIALDVEDAFNIILENEDMANMNTVTDALEIIESKLNNPS